MAIVKSKLLKEIADSYPNFLKGLEKSLNIFIKEIKFALYKNESVEIRDFGTWSIHTQKARDARNRNLAKKLKFRKKNSF